MHWDWMSFWIGAVTCEAITISLWWLGWKIVEHYADQGIPR